MNIPSISPHDLKELRKARRWTQEELAAQLGCSQPTVCKMEQGGKISRPFIKLLERLMAETDAREAA